MLSGQWSMRVSMKDSVQVAQAEGLAFLHGGDRG